MPTLSIAYRKAAWTTSLPSGTAAQYDVNSEGAVPAQSAQNAEPTLINTANERPPWPVVGGAIVGSLTGVILLIVILVLCCWRGGKTSSRGSSSASSSPPPSPRPPPVSSNPIPPAPPPVPPPVPAAVVPQNPPPPPPNSNPPRPTNQIPPGNGGPPRGQPQGQLGRPVPQMPRPILARSYTSAQHGSNQPMYPLPRTQTAPLLDSGPSMIDATFHEIIPPGLTPPPKRVRLKVKLDGKKIFADSTKHSVVAKTHTGKMGFVVHKAKEPPRLRRHRRIVDDSSSSASGSRSQSQQYQYGR